MATNGEIPVGDTEMAECDEEVVTMMDVLKEQQDFEDDANAVLGGSDEKECTYSQGYIKRQAIYACMTCCPDSKDDPSKRAGFCLACSLSCHENHDLVELYTKRNFRCDCGNPKFKSPCQFTPNKPELNDENVYNQNFIGLYCICSKPYDQESALDDEMIQCIVCEDWWHATHLDAVVPANDQYSEMICKLCMAKNEFFHDYSDLAVNIDQSSDVDVVNTNPVDGYSNKTDDKLANDSITNEKIVNGSVTDNKLNNGIEETSTSNDMETNTTVTPNEDTPAGDNEDVASSIEKEVIESEKSDNEIVEPEKLLLENSEANKSTDAAMDTDETDKATEVLPEVSSEDKPDTTCEDKTETTSVDKTESSVTSEDVTEEKATEDKTIETRITSEEKIEECGEPLAKKIEDSSTELENKIADIAGETPENTESSATESAGQPETPKQYDESTAKTHSETPNGENASEVIEKLAENIDTIESKITEDQETETDADKVSQERAKIDGPSAENDKPCTETNENTPDKAKTTETSQDEEMNETNKETENIIVPENSSDKDISKDEEAVNGDSKATDNTNKTESENNENIVPELASTENKRKLLTEDVTDDIISTKKPKLDESKCLRPKDVKKVYKGATFWPSTLRQKLCKCNECITMYKDLSVLFLTDLEDTVFAYETLGKERTAGKPNQYEKGIEALCSLGRIQQIDALTEYNKMRDKLLTFLQSFKDKQEIVTEHDIKTFFAGMKPEKRMDGVYFCG